MKRLLLLAGLVAGAVSLLRRHRHREDGEAWAHATAAPDLR